MADARESLNAALDELAAEHGWKDKLELIFDMTKVRYAHVDCPKCNYRKKYPVDVPDIHRIADSLSKLLDQAKGRPSESRAVELTVKTLEDLEKLSDRELSILVGSS